MMMMMMMIDEEEEDDSGDKDDKSVHLADYCNFSSVYLLSESDGH